MKIQWRNEEDEWTNSGKKITDKENLNKIKNILENEGPIIVEHWFYRGASSPERIIFEEYEKFIDYLEKKSFAGDAIDVWSFSELCKPENRIAFGKCPDEEGKIPQKGAY